MEINMPAFQFKDLYSKAKKVLILIGAPEAGAVYAALGLADLFKSQGSSAHLVSEVRLPASLGVISGSEEIKDKIETKSLIFSFDHQKNPIEKISYKIEGEKFNLIVKPRKGDFNLESVQTSFTGGDYNLIIILGAESLENLKVYSSNKDLFESLPTIDIDVSSANTRYGKLNILNSEIASISALVAKVLEDAKIKLTEKAATLLISGIREETQNFTKVGSAAVFEAAAYATKTIEGKISEAEEGGRDSTKESTSLPKDWLSPKVFRSSKVS